MSASHLLNRKNLADGTIRKLALERDGADSAILTDAELLASRQAIIPDEYDDDVWLFGYGSLIWNPVVDVKEQILGRIYGYHRRFCLRTKIGRGSPDLPGLILGLDNGGSCAGLALCIDRRIVKQELDLIWRREMINSSYIPKKVNFYAEDGRIFSAIAFVMNHQSPSYVSEMSLEEKAYIIANAKGFIGTSLDYLERTHDGLAGLGIHDGYLDRLRKMIARL